MSQTCPTGSTRRGGKAVCHFAPRPPQAKTLRGTAGCQHGAGKLQGSLPGLPAEHPPWGQGCGPRCRARPQQERRPPAAQPTQPCHTDGCGQSWTARGCTARRGQWQQARAAAAGAGGRCALLAPVAQQGWQGQKTTAATAAQGKTAF